MSDDINEIDEDELAFIEDERARIAALHLTCPNEIWLQVDPEAEQFDGWDAQTWCSDKINETDVRYVLAASRDAEVQRLQFALSDTEALELGTAERCDQLRAELAAEQANNTSLRDFIASAQVSSGVCCCGEAMDGHSSPMSCGHSPVDMWDHAVENLLDAPSDTSTPEQSLAEYRNKVIEQMIACYSPDDSAHDYFDKLNALKGQS